MGRKIIGIRLYDNVNKCVKSGYIGKNIEVNLTKNKYILNLGMLYLPTDALFYTEFPYKDYEDFVFVTNEIAPIVAIELTGVGEYEPYSHIEVTINYNGELKIFKHNIWVKFYFDQKGLWDD